jgi:hypothetical protein
VRLVTPLYPSRDFRDGLSVRGNQLEFYGISLVVVVVYKEELCERWKQKPKAEITLPTYPEGRHTDTLPADTSHT